MGQICQRMVVIEKLVSFFVFGDGLLKLAAEFERLTQIPMRGPKVGVQLESLLKLGYRLGITSRDDVTVGQVGIEDDGKGIKIDRTPQLSYRTVELAQREKDGVSKVVVREGVIGI